MTTLVMLSILFVGIAGYRKLPVSDLPNVDFPTILVSANVPGASPETMASAVATPLEKQFSTIAGIDSMTSTNAQGLTTITIQFNLSRNIDAAAQDVNSAIVGASRQLPQNMPSPPSYRKVNPADQPVLYLALSSPTLPLSTVDDYAQTLMAQRISMVSGVAQVQVFGSQKYAVRAKLNPRALASKGIGIDEVADRYRHREREPADRDALRREPGIHGPGHGPAERCPGLSSGHRRLPRTAPRSGCRNWARSSTAWRTTRSPAGIADTRAIILAVQRQPGTNTVEVVDSHQRAHTHVPRADAGVR